MKRTTRRELLKSSLAGVAILDYQPAPVICEIRNLSVAKDSLGKFRGADRGVVIECEGGFFLRFQERDAGGSEVHADFDAGHLADGPVRVNLERRCFGELRRRGR